MDLLQAILVESLKIRKVCIEKIKKIITKNNNLNEFAENTQAKLGFLKYEIWKFAITQEPFLKKR